MNTRNLATRRPSFTVALRPRASKSRTPQSVSVRKGRTPKASPSIAKDDAEADDATEKVSTRAAKRRKISDDVSEDTTPIQSVTALRVSSRTTRRSEPTRKAAIDDDASSPGPKSRARTVVRRRSTTACDTTTKSNQDETKALQEEKQSLKRDRQAFEQESQRERTELDKRETKADKLDSQLKTKLAAVKEKEHALKKRETECKKWEQALKKREAECARLEADLEERETVLQKNKQEIQDKALCLNISRGDEAIEELDTKWQCALCFDVMACPYSLSPTQCGHTYCAICLIKWYFTKLCNSCGDWCNQLDCPLCRTVLPRPFEVNERPRKMYTLPFTPARAADERIIQLLDSLRGPEPESPPKSSGNKKGKAKGKKKQAADAGGSDNELSTPSTGWEYGGTLRAEWEARNSLGRTEMRKLIDWWPQMTAASLKAYKTRICATP